MEKLSPKAHFDALAGMLDFDAGSVDAVRNSIRHLLPNVNELVRRVNEMMRHADAPLIVGEIAGERREHLQSLLASFIMRTINCNFDEEYCNYAHEVSRGPDVPPDLFSLGLALANDFVAQTLPRRIEDADQLARALESWNRLTAVLREVTRV
jgi:hypothetical protein